MNDTRNCLFQDWRQVEIQCEHCWSKNVDFEECDTISETYFCNSCKNSTIIEY